LGKDKFAIFGLKGKDRGQKPAGKTSVRKGLRNKSGRKSAVILPYSKASQAFLEGMDKGKKESRQRKGYQESGPGLRF